MILIVLAVIVAATSLRGLATTVRGDGLGHRPGPRSHAPDTFAASATHVART